MTLKWDAKSDRCLVAFVSRMRTNIRGKSFKSIEALRVIREAEGWRLDRADAVQGVWLPWEAVTPEVFPSSQAAMEHAETLGYYPENM